MSENQAIALTEAAQAVFARLLDFGEATRKRLAESIGFSFPTVTVALAELTAKRLVCELRREQGARIYNSGRLEAGVLTLHADTLDNTAALMGDDIAVRGRIIDHHGQPAVMAATRNLTLHAGERQSNINTIAHKTVFP